MPDLPAPVIHVRRCSHCAGSLADGVAFCPHCGASTTGLNGGRPAATGPIGPGVKMEGLTIVRPLGRGGTAEVYLARQDALDRLVAVKVVRQPIDDSTVWRHFQREAQAIARLSGHAHVIWVFTAGRTDSGQPYLVSEYMDRGSLDDVLTEAGPLSVSEAATLGVAVADALIATHAVGILHRDVKPQNVLLDSTGRIKLSDFGVARLMAGQSNTTTGSLAFTPQHVAPEILRGETEATAADVYGLASTIYTALTARPPFARTGNDRVDTIVARKLTEPATPLPMTLPSALREVVERSLNPQPEQRPSLAEVREVLAAVARNADDTVVVAGAAPVPVATSSTVVQPISGADLTLLRPQPPESVIHTGGPSAQRDVRPRGRRPLVLASCTGAILLLAFVAIFISRAGRGSTASGGESPGSVAELATTAVPPTAGTAPTTVATRASATTGSTASISPPTSTPAPVSEAPSRATTTSVVAGVVGPSISPAQRTKVADQFLRDYYGRLSAGDYAGAWTMLTPDFQRGTAGGFDRYRAFWQTISRTDISKVDVAKADQTWPMVARIRVAYTTRGRTVQETDELTLVSDSQGNPLISAYRVVG